ncbi:hypothetical protein BD779DRAFT_1612891 [Infundibulicybe gibba]|nr:hypothetical protein BD779DRAFT_1612891 [Infundibulicybe gibba]
MSLTSSFTASTLPVYRNVLKNIIFRASALCLQLAVYNLSSYTAFRSEAYTSFLMFAEGHIQRLLFVSSRGWSRAAFIVLAFAALSPLAGMYDALLWSLDSPGYVVRSSRVNASAVQDQLLTTPPYIAFVANPAGGDVRSIDVDATVTGNLFKSGFNFTLPAVNDLGKGEVVPARQSLAAAGGPRIWLDDEGLSVGIDPVSPIAPRCNLETRDDRSQAWACQTANNESFGMFLAPLGQPLVWWDGAHSEYIQASRKDNPWKSLGTGGNTAVMKQVFTVTKDRRRHTFLETAFKASMLSMFPAPFDNADITKMIRQALSDDFGDDIRTATQNLIDTTIATQANHSSFSGGTFLRQDLSVSASTIEFLNVTNTFDQSPIYAVLRATTTNITLIRSETLPVPSTPLSPCTLPFSNLATGGRVRSTTCDPSNSSPNTTTSSDPGTRFLGQLDASAVFILTEVLGDGGTAQAATALNATGLRWYQDRAAHIDQVLASRAFILGGTRASVLVDVQHAAPALSRLQLLLELLPVLAATVSILLIMRDKKGYFQCSFFAAKAGGCFAPPEIGLEIDDGRVVLTTPGGGVLRVVPGGMALRVPVGSRFSRRDVRKLFTPQHQN